MDIRSRAIVCLYTKFLYIGAIRNIFRDPRKMRCRRSAPWVSPTRARGPARSLSEWETGARPKEQTALARADWVQTHQRNRR